MRIIFGNSSLKYKIPIYIYFIFFFSSFVFSQNSRKITGVVTDQTTKNKLVGANIQIKNTFIGDVCDSDGKFSISGLKPEIYLLKISFIGFSSRTVRVDLRNQSNVDLEISLEPAPIKMDQIIVTGSRQPEELSAAVTSISVLDAKEIQSRNTFRLDESLLIIPGINLVGENINIRGGSGYNRLGGSRVLVLLDDVPILTSDLANINWNLIPVTAIDHVEVLKGAASSVYGSGALSGVINILTKNPNSHQKLSFRQSVGLYDEPSVKEWKWTDRTLFFHRTDIGYSNRFGPVGFRVDLAYHNSAGDRESSKFERWNLTGKSNIKLSNLSNLNFFISYSYDDRELFLRWLRQNNALNVPTSDLGNKLKLEGLVWYANYFRLFSSTLSTRLRISYNKQLLGIPLNISSAFRPALGFSSEMQINWLPHPDHSISAGIDYKRDQVDSKYYGKQNADGISPYIQEIWKISQIWQLNAGLRYDTYNLVGDSIETQLSPRIGFSYQPFPGSILHFSFGRGFRAASVVERFFSVAGGGDVRVVSNPLLQPERSTLFDVGLRQSIGKNLFAEVTAFRSIYRNLIELTLIPQSLNVQFITYPKAVISGIETTIQWKVWKEYLRLNATGTWMDPKYENSGEPLPYRPRFIGFIAPMVKIGPFEFEADFRYSSKLEKVLVYPRDEQVPTQVWNLRLSYRWQNYKFKFLINNAANYNYTVSERVLGEIRNFSFSVSGDF